MGSVAIPAAVVLHEGFSQAGAKAILIGILLFFSNPVLSHATARAARIRRKNQLSPAPDERIPALWRRRMSEAILRNGILIMVAAVATAVVFTREPCCPGNRSQLLWPHTRYHVFHFSGSRRGPLANRCGGGGLAADDPPRPGANQKAGQEMTRPAASFFFSCPLSPSPGCSLWHTAAWPRPDSFKARTATWSTR